jgi:hypothetical protein
MELFFLIFGGSETESTWYSAIIWPIVPAPDDRMLHDDECGAVGGINGGETKVLGRKIPSGALFTTNPT